MRRLVAHGVVWLLMASCGSDAGDEDDRVNSGLDELASPGRVVRAERQGDFIQIGRAELSIQRPFFLLATRNDRVGQPNPFTRRLASERRNSLVLIDWSTGQVRELLSAMPPGRLMLSHLPLIDGARAYNLTFASDLSRMFLQTLEPDAGAVGAEIELAMAASGCLAVAGGDLFFQTFDGGVAELRVARDFMASGFDGQSVEISDHFDCGSAFVSVRGEPASIERESGGIVTLWPIDRQSGARGSEPLARIETQGDIVGFSADDDGLYAFTQDAVAIDVYFSPIGAAPEQLERVIHIEVPFFAELVFTNGALSIGEVFAFSTRGGIVAMGVRINEDASDGNFFYTALLAADLEADRADLIELGGTVDSLLVLR